MAYYSHHRPMSKRAEGAPASTSVEKAIGALNPLESNLGNYGLYAGGGALAGAGLGALINALRGRSIGRGALGGGLLGAGLGAGIKGLGDYQLSDEKKILSASDKIEADRDWADSEWRKGRLWNWSTPQSVRDARAAGQILDIARNRPLLEALTGDRLQYNPEAQTPFHPGLLGYLTGR